jgi:GNAT superfamily N-acetyltransferase
MTPISIRPGVASDWAHVYDSFANEYRHSPHAKHTSDRQIKWSIGLLLKSPSWILTVACYPESPDEVCGWVLWAGRAVAWLHVKPMYRRHGFARALMASIGVDGGEVETPFVPHRTEIAANMPMWLESKGYKLRMRPGLLLTEAMRGS